MHVRHLSLLNFRNYEHLELDLDARVTVVYGDNAQGKSNLLEAFFYLATTRSFRARSDRDLLGWRVPNDPFGFTRIAARLERSGEPLEIEIVLREEPRAAEDGASSAALVKRIRLNDVPRRAIDVIGVVTAVMFSPEDLELVAGSPAARRRYLDVMISQIDRAYCRSLAQYNRVVLQRNHLLRAVRDHGAQLDQMRFWDEQLVGTGAYVITRRLETISLLGAAARRFYTELGGGEQLDIGYRSSVHRAGFAADSGEAPSCEMVARAFQERLAEMRPREIMLGMSLLGPHRDDLTFQIGGRDLGVFGSRGQQRSAALALKLAEAEHLHAQTGERPILLLDDVLSELDPSRRERVLAAVRSEQQVLLTTTDPTVFPGALLGEAAWLHVKQGRVEPRVLASTRG